MIFFQKELRSITPSKQTWTVSSYLPSYIYKLNVAKFSLWAELCWADYWEIFQVQIWLVKFVFCRPIRFKTRSNGQTFQFWQFQQSGSRWSWERSDYKQNCISFNCPRWSILSLSDKADEKVSLLSWLHTNSKFYFHKLQN